VRFTSVGAEATAQWRFTAPFAGQAEVFVQYPATPSRATSALYQIDTGNGVETATANQTIDGLTWVSLGTFSFEAGQRTITLNAALSSGGNAVNADAVRIVLSAAVPANADFDANGQVDGHDFLAWQRGLGTVDAASEQGDANGDSVVDAADLTIWQEQFGTETPPPELGASLSSAAANVQTYAAQGNGLIGVAQQELAMRSASTAESPVSLVAEPIFFSTQMPAAAPTRLVSGPNPTASMTTGQGGVDPVDADSAETLDQALEAYWSWR
jgi:hypothetical protein